MLLSLESRVEFHCYCILPSWIFFQASDAVKMQESRIPATVNVPPMMAHICNYRETSLSARRETFTQLKLEEGSCSWGIFWKHSKNWGWNYVRIIHKNHSLQWNKLVLDSSQPEPTTNPSSHSRNTAPFWAKLHLTQLSRTSVLFTSSYNCFLL